MIKIENTEVFGWEAAIRGMRNPMNSWDKSDSEYDVDWIDDSVCPHIEGHDDVVIGENDFSLMKRLVKSGTDHSKFMRMINVTCDITAPMYWWKEFDTYKVGTVRNSCSTMHKIAEKEFTLDDFSHELLSNYNREILEREVICALNRARQEYRSTPKYSEYRNMWWINMIQLLPSSYNQRSTVQLNYQVLRSMYHARRNHKLYEWKILCEWVESLPYSELITMKKDE